MDSYIYPYLPSNWNVPASVRLVTFRSVLNHTSGLCPLKATVPTAWACSVDQYADNTCHTSCGAWDADCGILGPF